MVILYYGFGLVILPNLCYLGIYEKAAHNPSEIIIIDARPKESASK
jgi:hypothetical protein